MENFPLPLYAGHFSNKLWHSDSVHRTMIHTPSRSTGILGSGVIGTTLSSRPSRAGSPLRRWRTWSADWNRLHNTRREWRQRTASVGADHQTASHSPLQAWVSPRVLLDPHGLCRFVISCTCIGARMVPCRFYVTVRSETWLRWKQQLVDVRNSEVLNLVGVKMTLYRSYVTLSISLLVKTALLKCYIIPRL